MNGTVWSYHMRFCTLHDLKTGAETPREQVKIPGSPSYIHTIMHSKETSDENYLLSICYVIQFLCDVSAGTMLSINT